MIYSKLYLVVKNNHLILNKNKKLIMEITVKVKDVEIHLNEDVNNTQIKYNNKDIIEILQKISDECLKLLKESKS